MRRLWERTLRYLGLFAGSERERERPLRFVVPAFVRGGWIFTAHTVALVASAVLAFGWDVADVALYGTIGALLWGVFMFAIDLGDQIPHGALPPAPESVVTVDPDVRWWRAPSVWLALAFFVAVAWRVEDDVEFACLILLGYPAGTAGISWYAAARTARWEREHGRRVLVREDAERGAELYAVAAIGR